MDGNLKAWRAHRALAWLYGISLLALGTYVYLGKATMPLQLLIAPAAVLLVLTVFHGFAARGARLRQPWARPASILIGFVLLVVFPIGTIIGLYLIGASWNPWPEMHVTSGAPTGGWPADAVRDRPHGARRS